jgi:Uma2 family endonuclease
MAAGGVGLRFVELAPDLAIEVLSPSDRPAEIRAKVIEYLRLGVSAIWVLDPTSRKVWVHTREDRQQGSKVTTTTLAEGELLEGGEVVPGFSCPVAELFSSLLR